MFILQKRIMLIVVVLFFAGIIFYILSKESVPQNSKNDFEKFPTTQNTELTDLGNPKGWVIYQNRQLGFQTLIPDKNTVTEELGENFMYFSFDGEKIPSLGNFSSSITIGIAQGNFINQGTRFIPDETINDKYLGEINGLRAYESINKSDAGEVESMMTILIGPAFDYYVDMSGGEFPKIYTSEEQAAYRTIVRNFKLSP